MTRRSYASQLGVPVFFNCSSKASKWTRIKRRRGNTRLAVNVSAEADAAYVADKGLKLGPTILKFWPVGTCALPVMPGGM